MVHAPHLPTRNIGAIRNEERFTPTPSGRPRARLSRTPKSSTESHLHAQPRAEEGCFSLRGRDLGWVRAWHSGGCAGSTRSLGFTRLEVACRLRRNGPRRRPWHGEREPEAPEPRGCLAASHPATPPTPRLSDRAHHPESTEGARSLALETVRFGGFSATGRERATERNFANWGAGAAPDPPGRCCRRSGSSVSYSSSSLLLYG